MVEYKQIVEHPTLERHWTAVSLDELALEQLRYPAIQRLTI